MKWVILLIIGWCVCPFLKGDEKSSTPLGYPIELSDIYISGGEIEPIPRKDQSGSIVIRIIEVKPADDGFRYDLSVYGLDPGSHNLVDYLQYIDSAEKLSGDPIPIEVTTINPLDELPKPLELESVSPGRLGGYKLTLILISLLWLVGLGLLLFYRKRKDSEDDLVEPEPTLHEKLQGLVLSASKGELSDGEQANLERLIIGHWKQEIPELDQVSPAVALTQLRKHPDASPLILKLEKWLHSPSKDIDLKEVTPLLAPFKNV